MSRYTADNMMIILLNPGATDADAERCAGFLLSAGWTLEMEHGQYVPCRDGRRMPLFDGRDIFKARMHGYGTLLAFMASDADCGETARVTGFAPEKSMAEGGLAVARARMDQGSAHVYVPSVAPSSVCWLEDIAAADGAVIASSAAQAFGMASPLSAEDTALFTRFLAASDESEEEERCRRSLGRWTRERWDRCRRVAQALVATRLNRGYLAVEGRATGGRREPSFTLLPGATLYRLPAGNPGRARQAAPRRRPGGRAPSVRSAAPAAAVGR